MIKWDDIPETNDVAKSFIQAREFVDAVESGEYPVAWLSGPGGVGKTHATIQAVQRWQARGLEPVYSNPANFADVLKAYRQAKGRRPIIMDEADVIFRSDKCLNLMKIATDRRGSGRYEGVNVRAPVVVTTNAPLGDTSRFKVDHRPHIAALFNRVPPVTISFDRYAGWEYACYLAFTTDLLRYTAKGQAISSATMIKALEWFTRHANDIELLSARTLWNAAEWMTVFSPATVEKNLEGAMRSGSLGRVNIPAVDWRTEVERKIKKARIERERGETIMWRDAA